MLIYKAFRWVRNIQQLTYFKQTSIKCLLCSPMSHSGCHVLRFWRTLVPKLLILGPLWRTIVTKMPPKIAQMVSKRVCRAPGVDTFWGSQNRLASKIAFGALLGTIWLILSPPWQQNRRFSYDCSTPFDEILDINSGHRFASSGLNVPIVR